MNVDTNICFLVQEKQTVFHNRENRWQHFCCCLCMHQEGFQRKASQTLQYTDQPHYSINIKTWFYGLFKKKKKKKNSPSTLISESTS